MTRLSELAVAGKLTWTDVRSCLDAADVDRAIESGWQALSAGLAPVAVVGPPMPETTLDDALDDIRAILPRLPNDCQRWNLVEAVGEALTQKPTKDRAAWWGDASAREAWLFELDMRNPGDGEGIPAFSRAKLARQLELAATMRPRTKWLKEWSTQLLAEQKYRKENPQR